MQARPIATTLPQGVERTATEERADLETSTKQKDNMAQDTRPEGREKTIILEIII